MTLAEFLLQRLLETSAPSIRSHVLLSQHKLETEYLPFAAGKNTADANARVSILLESLTRCLLQLGGGGGGLTVDSADLLRAVQSGVVKRLGKVADVDFNASANSAGAGAGAGGTGKRKTKGGQGGGVGGEDSHDEAWAWLVESGARIADLVRTASASASATATTTKNATVIV